jgi:hypothetical protein
MHEIQLYTIYHFSFLCFYARKCIVPKFKTNAHSKDQSHLNRDATPCLNRDMFNINPFQSNFSANRILPSSYLFWAVKRMMDYL